MGSNCLKTLPNLSKLVNLRVLNLAGNRIRNLTGISNLVLASKLRNFDIGNNLISDLCEFRNLQSFIYLELLFTFGNPCLSAVYANGGANLKIYRSYLISCIQPNQLKMLDSCVIAEDESLIGTVIITFEGYFYRTCWSVNQWPAKFGRFDHNSLGILVLLSSTTFWNFSFLLIMKAEEGFWRLLTPSNTFREPLSKKIFDFQGSPLWILMAFQNVVEDNR